MWKKSESEEPHHQSTPILPSPALSIQKNQALPAKEHAVIGSTISIKRNLTGEEDLLIEGKLEGKIELRHNSITIGKNGHIKADIYGKIITVDGTVEGNLYGEEQLVVHHCGTVRGNITAPRVALEDGCNFKGSIDMSPKDAVILPKD